MVAERQNCGRAGRGKDRGVVCPTLGVISTRHLAPLQVQVYEQMKLTVCSAGPGPDKEKPAPQRVFLGRKTLGTPAPSCSMQGKSVLPFRSPVATALCIRGERAR